MSNLSIKINLSKLQGAALVNIKGKTATKECLVIPVDDANLYKGEKGIYLNLTGVETKEQRYEQSHFVKQNLPTEVYKALTKEQQDALPIIGNIKPFAANTMQATDDLPEGGEVVEGDLPF